MKDNKSIKIKSLDIHKSVRDERIKDMITAVGGVVRVFNDKKRKAKADRVGRKAKYRRTED